MSNGKDPKNFPLQNPSTSKHGHGFPQRLSIKRQCISKKWLHSDAYPLQNCTLLVHLITSS